MSTTVIGKRAPSGTSLRAIYTHEQLKRLIAPRSIAIVGASPRAGAFGERTLANLSGYAGDVYLVNARYQEISGRPCYPSVAALPQVPDCVVITVGREAVEDVVRECGQCGVGGVVIYASGYAELGTPERIAEQQALTDLARQHNVRIVGPNCVGLISIDQSFGLTFSGGIRFAELGAHAVALASQSGAVGNAVFQGSHMGVDFSHLLTAGNSCDVDVADFISYLAGDASCKAIICIFEGLSNPERLLEAGDIARRAGKPLIVHKIATGSNGAKMAISHTGTIAGSQDGWRALFERMGAIVVEEFEALAETAAFFARAPRPRAFGAGVVSISGGFCVIHADKAEEHGVALPEPSGSVRETLLANLPDFALPNNPCDVTGAAVNNPGSMDNCCDAFLASEEYDTVVLTHSYAWDLLIPRIACLGPLAERRNKIACATWTSGWLDGPGAFEAAQHPHVAVFRSAERCFKTLALWFAHERARRQREADAAGAVETLSNQVSESARQTVAHLLADASAGVLPSAQARAALDAYGIAMAPVQVVTSGEAAAEVATRLGFPVALKIESADIAHKTEAGGVILNVHDAAGARHGFATLMENCVRHAPGARIDGVLVQPMMPGGLEVLVGARVDELFGPVVVLALGGVMVEVLKDRVLDFAPLDMRQARRLIGRLANQVLLDGFRGQAPVNREALAKVVCRMSQLIADHCERITELEVNPLICVAGEPVGVDALIVVKAPPAP